MTVAALLFAFGAGAARAESPVEEGAADGFAADGVAEKKPAPKPRDNNGRRKGPPKGDGKYDHELFADPSAGLVTWNDGTTTSSSLSVGGQAGVHYWEIGGPLPRYQGTGRVALSYLLGSTSTAGAGSQLSGWEARIGNFYGPTWRHAGIQAGPDLFHSQYRYNGEDLPSTNGLALPVTGFAWQKPFSAYVGLEPAWYLSDQEGTDWDEAELPGFGDEFSYKAGAAMQVKKLRVGIDAVWRQTPYGVQSGYGLALGYNK